MAHRGLNNLSVQTLSNATYAEELEIVDAAMDLINRYGLTFLTGYELGFADDMILAGDLARVDRALQEIEDLDLAGSLEGTADGARAELAVFRGDLPSAQAEVETMALAFADIQRADERSYLTVVEALVSWLAGDFATATEAICSAAEVLSSDMIPLRYATFIVGPSGDPTLVAKVEKQLSRTNPIVRPKRWFVALTAHLSATKNALSGHWEQARDGYLHVQRLIGELGFPLYGAIIGLEFDGYLGTRFAEAAAAGAGAEAYLTDLGVAEFVRQYRIHFAGTPAPAVGERAQAAVSVAPAEANVEAAT